MRLLTLLPFAVLFSIPLFAQSPPPAQRDPQAVAVVDAAITALGGSAAISQSQSWTFQAQIDGPMLNGTVSETVSVNAGPAAPVVMPNGVTIKKTPRAFPSAFVPSLIGAVLVKELKDPNYSMRYVGQTTLGSKAVTVVTFSLARTSFGIAQIWFFDSATGLPAGVEFRFPAQIGQAKSLPGTTIVSDYRSISGVLYPFRIVTVLPRRSLPETITLQSVSPSAAASMVPVASGGGAQ